MSTKATTIFFILIALAATRDLKEDYENVKGFIKPIIADLVDLSISNEEAVTKTIKNFNNVLGTQMVYEDMVSADKLAALFVVQNFLKTQNYKDGKFESADVDRESKKILEAFPTLDQAKLNGADNQKIKDTGLNAMRDAGLQYIALLHKAIVYELHLQLSNPKNKKFEFTKYEALTREFSKGATEKIKPYQVELNKAQVAMGSDITAVLKEYSENYKKFYNQYFFSSKHLASIYVEPTKTLRHILQTLAYEQAINAAQGAEINAAAAGRVQMVAEALATLTDQAEDTNLIVAFESLMGFASPTEDYGDLTANKNFKKLIDGASSKLLVGMLNILPADEVKLKAADYLSIGIETMSETEDMINIIYSSYQKELFAAASGENNEVSNAMKLRNFDYIVYLPAENLSDERLSSLMGNVANINSMDKRRVKLLNNLKSIIGTPLIDFNSHLELFASVYDLSVTCAAWTPEDKLENDANELFDECIEALASEKKSKFLTSNYAFVKFLNLFFMSEVTDYQTHFQQIDEADLSVIHFVTLMEHSSWLKNRMEYLYRDLNNGEASKKLVQTAIHYSGLTVPAKKFAAVNRSTSVTEEVREATQVNSNKIEVVLVKDKRNPLQPGSTDPLANKGESNSLPNLNIPSGAKVQIDGEPAKVHESPKKEEKNDLPHNGGNDVLPQIGGSNGSPLIIPSQVDEPKPRIQIGERKNLVNEIIGHLPKEHLEALKNGSVDDFINRSDLVVTKDGVETTFVFVKVTRKQSPCHPGNGKKC